jgi:tRNA A-37 threonylcarbamoyl transferase component Bud32
MNRASLAPGAVIRQKYRIGPVLGQGGMAVVFAADHLLLAQPVALKVLRPDVPAEPLVVERFLREARATLRLEGRHVARVLDVDVLDDGTPFIVMERLIGTDLFALARSRPLSIAEAVGYVREACEAIGEAHQKGIIHRDVKPANLFLARTPEGYDVLKVLDFGISKVALDTRLTAEEVGMGSAEYMSPEQIRSAATVDVRSDVWSLGATLYELTTGATPFHAETASAVLAKVLEGAPVPPRQVRPELPEGLAQVISRCLEKDPARRFASAAELSRALTPFATEGPPTRVLRAPVGKRGVPAGAFVAALLVAAIAAVLVFGPRLRPAASGARFSVDGDVVLDREAQLTWQRIPAPAALDWTAAAAHCAKAGQGYRLPTSGELEGLLAVLTVEPPLDAQAFSRTPVDVFWSATKGAEGTARVVSFANGAATEAVVSARKRVRCVR